MSLFFRHLIVLITIASLPLQAIAARVDTLDVYSPAMRKTTRCVVIRPDNYSPMGKPLPVVYLLHGWSGNYAAWLGDAPQLVRHADHYNVMIVCPDGGYDSWYLDSPVDSTVRYETHVAVELPGYIDYYYNTIRQPSGRVIAGLSMGGHGALYLAARHPEVFGAAGSMAGGLDLRPWKKNDWDLKGVLGDPKTAFENWEKHSVINLVERFKSSKQALIIDCGDRDFFLPMNRAVHERLLELGIPHEYTERPGEHNGEYWGNAIDYQFLFFQKFFSATFAAFSN
jgi:S-formylglutathione hydrolase FrmB